MRTKAAAVKSDENIPVYKKAPPKDVMAEGVNLRGERAIGMFERNFRRSRLGYAPKTADSNAKSNVEIIEDSHKKKTKNRLRKGSGEWCRMDKRFDVNDIKKLMYDASASGHLTIEMDADEGWLYISTDTVDDRNRRIDYSCTFPLDEWMLEEIKKAVKGAEIPLWETGECQYMNRINYDLNWNLAISTTEEKFKYRGWDAFPRGYDELDSGLQALAISLFDRFRFDLDGLKVIYLSTDARLNNETFSLSDNSLNVWIDDRRESMDTVPEYLEDVKAILKEFLLRPDEPKKRRPMEHGKCLQISLMDKYENHLCLWWGEERPVWIDDMVQRLYVALKTAYKDDRTVVKPIDPFLPGDPDKYYISEETKKVFTDAFNKAHSNLPINQDNFMETWNYIRHRKETLLRRSCIGKPVDDVEVRRYCQAAKELDQFRIGRLDFNRIDRILNDRDYSRVIPNSR